MPSPRSLAAGFFVWVFAGAAASAQVQVVHQGVDCVVADAHPVIAATFEPARIVRARVLFRADAGQPWYSAPMAPAATGYEAVLPRPKKSLRSFEYAIEALGVDLRTVTSEFFAPTVVGRDADCAGTVAARVREAATVTVSAPVAGADVPLVPDGFSDSRVGDGRVAPRVDEQGGRSGLMVAGVGVAVAGGLAAATLSGADEALGTPPVGPLAIVLRPSATPIVNVTAVTFTAVNSDAGNPHTWNFGDGATATGASVSHTFTREGVFTVTLSVSEAGTTRSSSIDVSVGSLTGVWIQQNPFDNGVFVSLDLVQSGASLSGAWTLDATAVGAGLDSGAAIGSISSQGAATVERIEGCPQRLVNASVATNLGSMIGEVDIGAGCPGIAPLTLFRTFRRQTGAAN